MKPAAVVCLSGGMDSCVCLALAVRDYDPAVLHFDYGQRTQAREREAFIAMADYYGITRRLIVTTELFRQIGGSALTDASLPVPEAGVDPSVIPITYVPFRNAHFLAAGVSWAETLGAGIVIIGAVAPDSSGYPDCRPEYYAAFNELLRVGTKSGDIRIATPLLHMGKADIVRLGLELHAPFPLSWSCYQNAGRACGRCDSCRLRRRAFRQAGASDPAAYAVTVEE
ncbi:MAG: 7-cyano-7-deazaguanine synthase QueC [Acidobacteria bacterium]|nr:MAG: 7-cyano-7-deazaguanine synthase QueC [Acidobacteriota bacterium]